jgi:hypothetical protein
LNAPTLQVEAELHALRTAPVSIEEAMKLSVSELKYLPLFDHSSPLLIASISLDVHQKMAPT